MSPNPLLSVSEAQEQLLKAFAPVQTETAPLEAAAGRVLAEPVFSSIDLPPFPNSSMDGFAVRVEDVVEASQKNPVRLTVVADVPAGEVTNIVLRSGQAARIMTGAPLPVGAEGVVPVEDTDFDSRQAGIPAPKHVKVYRPVAMGEFVRPQGQDVQRGEMVLPEGIRLRPQDVGFLAMLGVAQVVLRRKPKVAVFSSGDELLPVEEPLTPGKVHDANSYSLVALVRQSGCEPLYLGIARDEASEVQALLEEAVEDRVDLILTSAGVSVGAFDFVRSVVEEHGKLGFWRVNMRPGKPLAFGQYRNIPFIGLPGNPVSAFVGFEVFVRGALQKLSGIEDWQRPRQQVKLLEDVESDGRESYLRAIVNRKEGELVAYLTGHQGSGNLRSLVQANALLIVPAGVQRVPAGEALDAWVLEKV